MKVFSLIYLLMFSATVIAATPQNKPVTPYNDVITAVDIDSGSITLRDGGEKTLAHPVYIITINKQLFPVEALAPDMQIQYATDEQGIHFIVIQSTVSEDIWKK